MTATMISAASSSEHTGFVRLANEKIRSLCTSSVSGISSLKELGLFGMLSAVLSNPSFDSAYGGMQALLLKHCKNKYYSLHKSWNRLSELGLLKRTRIPAGPNRFRDYYDLLSVPDTASPAVRHLTGTEGSAYRTARLPFLPPEQDFTMVSYTMLMDSRLSLSAKGLYAVLARKIRISGVCSSEPVSKDAVFRSCREGRNAFDAIWRELRTCGYLILTRVWDAARKKVCFRYFLNSDPVSSDIDHAEPVSSSQNSCVLAMKKKEVHTDTVHTAADVPPVSVQNIREQIEYACLIAEYPRERVDLIVSVLEEQLRAVQNHQSENRGIRIGGAFITDQELRTRLISLNSEDVRFVLDAYIAAAKRTKILHTRKYLLSCLFHAKENLHAALETFAGSIGF